jgi:hypothetical protein
MPTPERRQEMLGNCQVILKEVSMSDDYIPEFKTILKPLVEAQVVIFVAEQDMLSFRDYGPQRHGEIVGERQEG